MTSSFIGKVLDNYRILENLGTGGMGLVFKAIHTKLDKLFALKMMAPGLVMNENFIRRFQAEAKALARFEDPNIVRIYDLRSFNDQWFIVMEFVEGINLLEKIKQDGPFHWRQALPILRQMLTAIGHAHQAGIIHRDIKPNNIMLTPEGLVKITDFGLAKDQTTPGQTQTVASGGTLYYMSPEHIKGFSFTDKRSDIYSIGMTFYEMITGSVPFKDMNSDFAIREFIIREEFERPTAINPEIPFDLEAIVMKSIAKSPNHRFQSTDDMLRQVQNFEQNYRPTFSRTGIFRKTGSGSSLLVKKLSVARSLRPNRRKWRNAGIAIAGLIIMILMWRFIHFDRLAPDSRITVLPDSALLSVGSTPPAAVHLNGNLIGQTPLTGYTVASGSHMLRLAHPGFQERDTSVFIESGHHLHLSFALTSLTVQPKSEKKPSTTPTASKLSGTTGVQLSIRSDPNGAEVWIDGQMRGKTPLNITDLPAGNYHLRIRKSGYLEYTHPVTLKQGESFNLTAPLSLLTGGLVIKTIPDSVLVKLDGKVLPGNRSPYSLSRLSTGKHRIEVSRRGYFPHIAELQIQPDLISEINIQLTQQTGILSVQVRPWGSIYLNDKLQKESTDLKQEMQLPVDQYRLTVLHPTLGRWDKKLKVETDTRQDILVDFTRQIPVMVSAQDEAGNSLSAEIYIDGEASGRNTPAQVLLRTGLRRLAVRKTGYQLREMEREILVDTELNQQQQFILNSVNPAP